MATKIVTKNSSTASAVPTASDLVQGELAVNVADKRLFTEDNGGSIVELGTKPSTIDINAGSIDGTAIGASSASTGAFTTLTASGIDVTGTATMDGLTVDGASDLNGNVTIGSSITTLLTGNDIEFQRAGNSYLSQTGGGALSIRTNDGVSNKVRMNLASNGDISFYEDTGTTPKFFWDASAESLGIGTSSPDTQLTLYKASTNADVDYAKIRMDSWGGSTGKLKSIVWDDAGSSVAGIGAEYDGGKTNIHFHSQYNGGFKGTADRTMSIMGNGNVGIGTSSPTSYYTGADNLVVYQASGEAGITIATASDTNGALYFADGTSGDAEYRGGIAYNHSTDVLSLVSGGANRAYIDSSGNVGIGIAPIPDSAGYSGGTLHIHQPSTAASKGASLRLTNATNGSTAGTDGFYISQWEDTNTYFVNQEGSQLFYTGGSERMRIDSSGNVGIGTSSFNATYDPRLQVTSAASDGTGGVLIQNYLPTLTLEDISGGAAVSQIQQDQTNMVFKNNGAERMRIDSSGRVNIGGYENSQGYELEVVNDTDANTLLLHREEVSVGVVSTLGFQGTQANDQSARFAEISSEFDALWGGDLVFSTKPANGTPNNTVSERMRIDSSGNLLVGTTSSSLTNAHGIQLLPASGGANKPRINIATAGYTSGDFPLSIWSTAVAAWRFYVNAAGTIHAVSTTITSLSDERVKENIRDLDDGLSKVMQLQPRKFDWKEGKGKNITNDRGFIAQEFEQVFPDLVSEWKDEAPEGEEPYKAVSADLIPTLVKAIQEQQTLIESLTARIAALEE